MPAVGSPLIWADHYQMYRQWSAKAAKLAGRKRDIDGEIQGILDAVLARDSQLAVARLREHYERSVATILEVGLVEGVEATTPLAGERH